MHGSLKAISVAVLFILFSVLIYDMRQANRYKEEIKIALNIATKAATLQVDKNPEKIAQGIFEIDTVASKKVFEEYLAANLDAIRTDVLIYVIDHKAINTSTRTEYSHPITGEKKVIDHPTFVAVMRYNYKGIFISREIIIDNLSGTRMTSPGN